MGLISASNRIEIGTAVIDMLYESPLYMAEDAGATDLIAGRGAPPRNRISEET
jgi:alkanesulfonate monooxygenase SsuD/methylene tetrahydromethanopterin reductase-like flavin-dependent oxidoreductase (luciferase family)